MKNLIKKFLRIAKLTLLVMVVVSVMSALFVYRDNIVDLVKNEEVYTKPQTIVKTEWVVENELEVRIEEAQASARDEIEKEAQVAYDKFVVDEMKEVADKVKGEYITEIEETISSAEY